MTGLEALNCLKNDECYTLHEYNECYDTIEKELKSLKALEIIINKELNIYFVKRMSLEDFNFQCQIQQQLTQEEYDLLKEVLL